MENVKFDTYQCDRNHVYIIFGKRLRSAGVDENRMNPIGSNFLLIFFFFVSFFDLGNASNWLDLAEWLADRGARKIAIVVKRCLMSSINSRRYVRILSIATVRGQVIAEFSFDQVRQTRVPERVRTNRIGRVPEQPGRLAELAEPFVGVRRDRVRVRRQSGRY